MKHKPNAIWHMVKWGMGSGLILAVLFIFSLVTFFGDISTADALAALFNPALWLLSCIFGAIPGAILGFIEGIILEHLTYVAPMNTKADIERQRFAVYLAIFLTTFLGGLFLMATFLFTDTFIVFIPPLIAAVAATYAAHRYLFRLRLWSELVHGSIRNIERKSKAKNDHIAYKHLREQDAENETPVTIEATQANTREAQ